MAFEFFSYVEEGQYNPSTTFHNTTQSWVGFIFRNGTSDTDPLISYPLFGLGNSKIDMKYNDSVTELGKLAVNDLSDWCSACASISLFCEAILGNESSGSESKNNDRLHSKGVNGVVGGIIGAIVTLVIVNLILLVLGLLGFRIQYREKRLPNSVAGMGVSKRSHFWDLRATYVEDSVETERIAISPSLMVVATESFSHIEIQYLKFRSGFDMDKKARKKERKKEFL